jgi:hypothetical protein
MQRSAFQRACYKGFADIVTLLLESGAGSDVNSRDDVRKVEFYMAHKLYAFRYETCRQAQQRCMIAVVRGTRK